jgi:predicted phage replisome organizer
MPEIKWIKITTDMFDDEKIKLIERMPDADSLLVIWIKLICQAGKVNDNGYVYLARDLPYTDEDLATIFNRPVNVIRLALATFNRLNMIQTDDTGTIYLTNFEKHQNIDTLSKIRDDTRLRQRKFRENQKLKLIEASNVTVTLRNDTEEEEERRIEEDKSKREEEKLSGLKKLVENGNYEKIQIGSETLASIIRVLNGHQPASELNKQIYREQLKKLEIDPVSVGIKEQEAADGR